MKTLASKYRRLRAKLVGRPQLVIPVPVLGLTEEQAEHVYYQGRCLWPPAQRRRGLRLPAPSDAEWAQRYNDMKNGHVTYRPEVAQQRLLGLAGGPQTSFDRLVIEPVVRPERT